MNRGYTVQGDNSKFLYWVSNSHLGPLSVSYVPTKLLMKFWKIKKKTNYIIKHCKYLIPVSSHWPQQTFNCPFLIWNETTSFWIDWFHLFFNRKTLFKVNPLMLKATSDADNIRCRVHGILWDIATLCEDVNHLLLQSQPERWAKLGSLHERGILTSHNVIYA